MQDAWKSSRAEIRPSGFPFPLPACRRGAGGGWGGGQEGELTAGNRSQTAKQFNRGASAELAKRRGMRRALKLIPFLRSRR